MIGTLDTTFNAAVPHVNLASGQPGASDGKTPRVRELNAVEGDQHSYAVALNVDHLMDMAPDGLYAQPSVITQTDHLHFGPILSSSVI
jgi:hypothetical protein